MHEVAVGRQTTDGQRWAADGVILHLHWRGCQDPLGVQPRQPFFVADAGQGTPTTSREKRIGSIHKERPQTWFARRVSTGARLTATDAASGHSVGRLYP